MSAWPALSVFFQNPNGICSPDVLASAGILPDPKAIANVVTNTGSIRVPMLHGQYGHTITQSVAAKRGARQEDCWLYLMQLEPALEAANKTVEELNGTVSTKVKYIKTLCQQPVGGIIAVICHWDPTLLWIVSSRQSLISQPSLPPTPFPISTSNCFTPSIKTKDIPTSIACQHSLTPWTDM